MPASGQSTGARLAADIGGTFTDVVLEADGARHSTKVLTTAEAPEDGVIDGIGRLLAQSGKQPGDIAVFVHGTTLATNALIERKGATVGFVTTEGFRDILEMGYEKRFDHYDLMIDAVPPLVPRPLRHTVGGRLAADGSEIEPLDEARLAEIAAEMTRQGVEAVAVGFLHAYAHSRHEARAAAVLEAHLGPDVTVCKSHEVCPEIREYERFSTTCANAAVRPLMSGYLHRMQTRLVAMGIRAPVYLMMSGGGLTTLENAARFPIRLVESGPAGGAILASHIAGECGLDQVLSFDMGGTTAKICLISHGEPERARKFEIARTYRDLKGSGWPVRIPVIEMVEIGAGGGSIARIDALNRIAVGPDSAGSSPGPVSYGLGGAAPTVTDANVRLGKIDPAYFAGGQIALDEAAADAALMRDIGQPLGLEGAWPAAGIAEMVEENMANAARVHAIERGKDIGACTMIAFGGAAPLHVCRLADKLGIERIVVPKGAGVGSAIGFLRAPLAYEVTRSAFFALEGFDAGRANALIGEMEADALEVIEPALGGAAPTRSRIADMRYIGQGHEIPVPLPDRALEPCDGQGLREAFEALYERVYGLTIPSMGVEIVTWSVTLSAGRPAMTAAPAVEEAPAGTPTATRDIFDAQLGAMVRAPVHDRDGLAPGARVEGPAIIAEAETSTIVTGAFAARVDGLGNLVLDRRTA